MSSSVASKSHMSFGLLFFPRAKLTILVHAIQLTSELNPWPPCLFTSAILQRTRQHTVGPSYRMRSTFGRFGLFLLRQLRLVGFTFPCIWFRFRPKGGKWRGTSGTSCQLNRSGSIHVPVAAATAWQWQSVISITLCLQTAFSLHVAAHRPARVYRLII